MLFEKLRLPLSSIYPPPRPGLVGEFLAPRGRGNLAMAGNGHAPQVSGKSSSRFGPRVPEIARVLDMCGVAAMPVAKSKHWPSDATYQKPA